MKKNLDFKKIQKENEELSFDYSDLSKPKEEKIKEEIRRRNQAYLSLDYMLSNVSYFDFFSYDTTKIIKLSHCITKDCKKSLITSEFILLSYLLNVDPSLIPIFKKHGLTVQSVGTLITKSNNLIKTPYIKKYKKIFQEKLLAVLDVIFGPAKKPSDKKNVSFFNDINYSNEVDVLFEKAAENAIIRFKTPVVNSDILFITMLEEKNSPAGKILKKLVSKPMDWYLLRFELLKRLHRKESILRTDVKINYRYFAYLLNIQYSDKELEKIIKNDLLSQNVLLFRNRIIKNTLSKNFFHVLAEEIHDSIEISTKRVYNYY